MVDFKNGFPDAAFFMSIHEQKITSESLILSYDNWDVPIQSQTGWTQYKKWIKIKLEFFLAEI